jgi:acyl carrier protein
MMQISRDDIEKLTRGAVEDALEEQDLEVPADLGTETKLFGRNAPLDSLGLVSLVMEIEERLEEEHSLSVVLADERAMSRRASPFRTLGSLVDYIEECLRSGQHVQS